MKIEIDLFFQDKKTKKKKLINYKCYSIDELSTTIKNAVERSDMRVLGLIRGGKKIRRF